MARVTHIRRVFDDGVISSTDYDNSQDAIDDGVFSAMGAQETGLTYIDPDTGYTSSSTGSSYIDIEVADQITLDSGTGFAFQKIVRTFLWGDPWASDDPSWGNAGSNGAQKILNNLVGSNLLDNNRRTFVKMVLRDPNDDSSAIPVPIISSSAVTAAAGFQYQGTVYTLDNTSSSVNVTRLVAPARIVNYDNDTRKIDDSLFVDADIIEAISRTSATGFAWKKMILNADNSAYYNLPNIQGIPGDAALGNSGIDPPWMLDPLQRIVNVSPLEPEHFLVFFAEAIIGENTTENVVFELSSKGINFTVFITPDGHYFISTDPLYYDVPLGSRSVGEGGILHGQAFSPVLATNTVPWPVGQLGFMLASTDGLIWNQRVGPAMPEPFELPSAPNALKRIVLPQPGMVAFEANWVAVSSTGASTDNPQVQLSASYDLGKSWSNTVLPGINGSVGAGGKKDPDRFFAAGGTPDTNTIPYTASVSATTKKITWETSSAIPASQQFAQATLQFFTYIKETDIFFTAHANESILYVSNDGDTWSGVRPFTQGNVFGIAYDSSRKLYVCVGEHAEDSFAINNHFLSATSGDGRSWSQQDHGIGSAGGTSLVGTKVAASNGIFISAVSRGLKPVVWVSGDGVSWHDVDLPEIDAGENPITDGDDNPIAPGNPFAITHVEVIRSKGSSLFAVLGCQGFATACQSFFIFTSTDGQLWTTALKRTSQDVGQFSLGGLGVGRVE